MSKVLNIAVDDYANFAYDNAMALQSIGVEAESFVMKRHPFGYARTSRLIHQSQLPGLIEQADVVQVFHSPVELAPLLRHCRKPVVVYYTGTAYRQNPEACHKAFGFAACTVVALPELWAVAKAAGIEAVYQVGAIAVPEEVDFTTNRPVLFAHYPSNPEVKGTQRVRKIFDQLPYNNAQVFLSSSRVRYEVQLHRLEQCDVYVEMMATMQGNKPYGSFGITALEAAARGKVVATNCVREDVYQEHYGPAPFIFANTEEDMLRELTQLATIPTAQLEELKKSFHTRFINLHTYKATGRYINDRILKGLFKTPSLV